MNRHSLLIIVPTLVFLLASNAAAAVNFDSFESDEQIDRWLREASKTYASITKEISARTNIRGYRFASKDDIARGMMAWVDGWLEIQLNPKLTGAARVNTLIFEVANAYRSPEHVAIDHGVDQGIIHSRREFAIAHEIYEYEALRIHREVLKEIAAVTGSLPKAFFYFVTPAPASIDEYNLPHLHDYLKAQQQSGHTDHYHEQYKLRKKALRKQAGR